MAQMLLLTLITAAAFMQSYVFAIFLTSFCNFEKAQNTMWTQTRDIHTNKEIISYPIPKINS